MLDLDRINWAGVSALGTMVLFGAAWLDMVLVHDVRATIKKNRPVEKWQLAYHLAVVAIAGALGTWLIITASYKDPWPYWLAGTSAGLVLALVFAGRAYSYPPKHAKAERR